jgi:AcrR family transcriptional regulator
MGEEGSRLMGQNTKGEKSKELLIECAASLFLQNGYNATGINDILNAAGLSKGSFYFCFSSKKELAGEVAEYYSKNKLKELARVAEEKKTWGPFVEAVACNVIENARQQKSFGCPLAVLGMEIAFLEPDLSLKYYTCLRGIADVFAEVLRKSGVPEEKAAALADQALAIYEGHLLFYRISKDIHELEKLLEQMKPIAQVQ